MNLSHFAPRPLLMGLLVLLGLYGRTHAFDTNWTGAVSTDWSDPANWSSGLPGADDRAFMETNSGNMPFVSGVGEQVTVDTLWVGRNSGANPTLTIQNGGSVTTTFLRTGSSSASGLIEVTGAGSKLINDGRGSWINGGIRLKDGAVLEDRGLGLELGNFSNGTGTVVITGGASYVNNAGGLFDIGRTSSGSGSTSVSGTGSSLTTNGTMRVGNGGTGVLSVFDNGTVSVDRFVIAEDSGSVGLVNIGTGGQAGTIGSNSKITGGDGNATLRLNHNQAAYTLATGLDGSLKLEHIGSGTTTLTGSTSTSGTTTVSNGRLEFGNGGGATHLLAGNIVNDAEIAVNGTGVSIFSGDHSGSGSLEQDGSGTLVLNGANTHTGGTSVLAGELHIGNGGTSGSITGNIANEGLVVFNRSDAVTYGGVISGTGGLIKTGQGTLTLSGQHTFTGAVDVEVGTLTLNGGFGTGGDVTVFTNAILNGTGSINRNVVINQDGTLGSGLIVNGNVTTSSVNNLGSVSSGTSTALSNETLVVDQATGGTIDASAGTAQITTLDGATVEAGNLGTTIDTLNSGTVNSTGGVRVNNLSGGDINVGAGANVTAQQGTFTGSIGGDGGLVKQGTGTLRLESANNHAGTTQVWGGTLEILNLGALGQVPVVRLQNDSTFRVVNGADVRDAEIVIENPLTNYRHDFNPGDNLDNSGSISDGDQTAKIGAGTAGGNTTLQVTFNQANRLSLEGIDGSTFGLLMSDTLPDSMIASEAFLGWYDPVDGAIKNAVVGNHGADGALAGFHNMSFEEFLAANGGWNAATMLGAYGTDLLADEVWAVIDHNSEFTVVPEPGFYGLLLGLAASWTLVRRRR